MKLGAELYEYKGVLISYFYAVTDTEIYITLDDTYGLSSDEQAELELEIKEYLSGGAT